MEFPAARKNILVLDKGSRVLSAVDQVLFYGDYNLLTIYDPNSVYDRAKELNPDLIILDYLLLDADCEDIINDLKEDEQLREIPVIVVTVYRSKKVIADSYKYDALFIKPKDMDVLASRIEYLMAS
ncbi:response regulator [Mucilaginibacter sp. BJC16-A38]|uniref:response regulator n=1 Tax=Mucilaginibacter phenanthrenivorans TaxID=1234842 RepID=UPI002157FEE0|nr:response regulator [Mucilaginibacter phenanthrenivorans]MCR8559616.1 response regulator [Mucilaginibacter phenanthrenivorans]